MKSEHKKTDLLWTTIGISLTLIFFVGGFTLLVFINQKDLDERKRIESTPAYQACLKEKSTKSNGEVDGVYYTWRCTDEGMLVHESATPEEIQAEQQESMPGHCDRYRC